MFGAGQFFQTGLVNTAEKGVRLDASLLHCCSVGVGDTFVRELQPVQCRTVLYEETTAS